MIDEKAALNGVKEALGDIPVEDVAIAFPVGATRGQAGGALVGMPVGRHSELLLS
ncbi:hypothetical protein U6G28_10655 [Actinomycetaceae bacterium MB13-C1-2]|nr:hypothetical protein U6G28_10655 [Actinomycetaceae bacterium MB13-C1-2]